MAKTVQCDRPVRCRGKDVAKCYGYDRAVLHGAHKDGLCVPCQEGEEVEGGEEEVMVSSCTALKKLCSIKWVTTSLSLMVTRR